MHLDSTQVGIVSQLLKSKFDFSKQDFDEILDHYCSQVEVAIGHGDTFQEALAQNLSTQAIPEIINLEHNLKSSFITRNQKVIAFIIIVTLALMTFLYLGTLNQKIPAEIAAESQNTDADWPLESHCEISSKFGMRFHPIHKKYKFHQGIDIPAQSGTRILAVNSGSVIGLGYDVNGYGNYIEIMHDDGIVTLYSQLSKIMVLKDEIISKGQEVGHIGSSGASTAPHLHLEVQKNGKKIDPLTYIKV